MRRSFLAIACALTLSACGTAQGVMNGVGAVLDGMGNDASSLVAFSTEQTSRAYLFNEPREFVGFSA